MEMKMLPFVIDAAVWVCECFFDRESELAVSSN